MEEFVHNQILAIAAELAILGPIVKHQFAILHAKTAASVVDITHVIARQLDMLEHFAKLQFVIQLAKREAVIDPIIAIVLEQDSKEPFVTNSHVRIPANMVVNVLARIYAAAMEPVTIQMFVKFPSAILDARMEEYALHQTPAIVHKRDGMEICARFQFAMKSTVCTIQHAQDTMSAIVKEQDGSEPIATSISMNAHKREWPYVKAESNASTPMEVIVAHAHPDTLDNDEFLASQTWPHVLPSVVKHVNKTRRALLQTLVIVQERVIPDLIVKPTSTNVPPAWTESTVPKLQIVPTRRVRIFVEIVQIGHFRVILEMLTLVLEATDVKHCAILHVLMDSIVSNQIRVRRFQKIVLLWS